ncbi:SDR family oxidoreductase [Nocardia cyriacigeorgica]|uniref:SDR family oxidoreductase n=1 Tax=Nocardia cyriacigeorgica TaxID=135487 RepID=UPI002456C683|nr:SDR family oxidoreductase [Nocardia cyriacigeorgica]
MTEATVVAITGGGRGIGRAIAERLAADGMSVAIGDIDAEAAAAAAASIPGALGLPLDVADPTSFDLFLDQVETALGAVDVLVNNAGIMPIGPLLDQPESLRRRAVDINLHGPLNGICAVLPRMRARGRGHIVNIASTAGVAPVPGGVVYCATKHAVVGMSEAVRQEFAADGIAVSAILPTFTNTELISGTKGLRGLPTVEPAAVADAVAKAIARKRTIATVPRYLLGMFKLNALLPKAVTDRMAKVAGVDRAFLDIDHAARDAYDKRIKG